MAFAQRLRDNEDRVWRLLFVAAFIGSVCCTIVVLGGLAAVTAYCFDNQPSGIAVGMKTEMPLTRLTNEVMSIEKARVTAADGSFQCDKFFRYDWTLWALQAFWLIVFGTLWYLGCIRRFLHGLWTKDELHTDGFVIGLGLIGCCIANFSLMFLAGPYSEREARQGSRRINSLGSNHTPGSSDAAFDKAANSMHTGVAAEV
ncbi:hypothetical protein C2E20_8942 [Micractinium conductrix]|uniref:Uncharacterized protein n=1 Tax=Micractinium conductrix TaxID=554055 RepID=A0A2P6UZW0_9CHLO|nr:hypothetical protein C2E20_8942 [Micractinium conductrix]|eukprot:PSC67371.1 hypothetical protein C2E20_8942 [Micractinium conductrix]